MTNIVVLHVEKAVRCTQNASSEAPVRNIDVFVLVVTNPETLYLDAWSRNDVGQNSKKKIKWPWFEGIWFEDQNISYAENNINITTLIKVWPRLFYYNNFELLLW